MESRCADLLSTYVVQLCCATTMGNCAVLSCSLDEQALSWSLAQQTCCAVVICSAVQAAAKFYGAIVPSDLLHFTAHLCCGPAMGEIAWHMQWHRQWHMNTRRCRLPGARQLQTHLQLMYAYHGPLHLLSTLNDDWMGCRYGTDDMTDQVSWYGVLT